MEAIYKMSLLGVDIVDISRLSIPVVDRIKKRVLSANEIRQLDSYRIERRKIEFFAGRFAAKEAFFKALGIGIFNSYLELVQVINNPEGKPEIVISPQLKELYLKEINTILLSISHDGDYAVAVVLLEK